MATPSQLLSQAKGQISDYALRKPAVRQPNTQGTRGTPGRGGVAARPVPKLSGSPGGQSAGSGGVLGAAGRDSMQADLTRTFPGFKPKPPDGGGSAGSTGGLQTLSGREPAMTPDKPMVEPAPAAPPKPAWQQLAERGIGGQGSAAANKAKLAELLGGGPAQAASDAAALDLPAASAGPRPLPPGAEPGGVGASVSGGLTPEQRASATPMPMPTASFPGFKPRPGAGMTAGAPGGLTARPMPGRIPTDGPQPAAPGGLGQTISDPADQMSGFEGLGRVGAGLRRPRPQAVAY